MNTSVELQKLYDSGLQFTVQPYGDCGFIVRHGNYLHEPDNSVVVPTFEAAVTWLQEKAGTGEITATRSVSAVR
jgi:hypothetical protein